jgi:hypothetical protein
MADRYFYPLLGLIVAGMIALSFVWPQGLGARSPAPFGHAPEKAAPPAAPAHPATAPFEPR